MRIRLLSAFLGLLLALAAWVPAWAQAKVTPETLIIRTPSTHPHPAAFLLRPVGFLFCPLSCFIFHSFSSVRITL